MDSSVYLGVWTNWGKTRLVVSLLRTNLEHQLTFEPLYLEYGKVNGLTLTTDQPWRDVLIAAIALVITFTGAQIWGVVCFLAFRFRLLAIGDHVYHHVQAALRNSSSSPTSFALRMLEVAWAQRPYHLAHSSAATGLIQANDGHSYPHPNHLHDAGSEKHTREKSQGAFGASLLRLSGLLALAVGFSAAFTTISLLGVQFFRAPDDSALIASQYCGWAAEVNDLDDLATPEARDTSAMLMVPNRARYQRVRAYARSCYAEAADGELTKQCDTFVTPRITSTMTTGAACPFPGDGACKTDAVTIESGRIDSRTTLGINTVDEDRVAVKKSFTCAPINADQWATDWIDGAQFGYVEGDLIKGYAVGTLPGKEPPQSEYPFVSTMYSVTFATSPYPLTSVCCPLLCYRTRSVTDSIGRQVADSHAR
jgi:hypothetical protein